MSLLEVKSELARRLKERRETYLHGISPEDIAAEAKERRLKVGAKTIRDYENPETCNPTLETLFSLLSLYGMTLHDVFSFTSTSEQPALVNEFLKVTEDEELRKALRVILSRLRPRSPIKK